MKTRSTKMIITGIALGLCLPLMAQPGQGRGQGEGQGKDATEGRKREKMGEHARLSEEGRAIMKQHHETQKEQMKARMQQRREAQKAFRETMQKETDPHKKLDMLAANITERKAHMTESADSAQQARLTALAKALEASGITGAEREQILGRMLENQTTRLDKAEEHTEKVLAEIEALRAKPDLTVEDVREAARSISRKARQSRGGPDTLINIDRRGGKERKRPGRDNKPANQQAEEPAI